MNDDKKFVVSGVKYPTDSEALKAVNEINGIKYVKDRTDMSNPKLVLNVYNKMLDKNLFTTINGYKYLLETRENLLASDEIDDKDVRPIEAPTFGGSSFAERKKSESPFKSKFINSVIINVLLIITIVVMIVITTNSNNLNILNYKDRLAAMYEEKENELAIWNSKLYEMESSINAVLDENEETTTEEATDESETTVAE
ncbi:MAG: hypothetical protein E7266_09185 [Lachnospiraceae bacterium]|nr:hypothetical protein [Lachnospiraceae bacterium]